MRQLETRFTSRIEPGKTPGTRSEPRLEYQAMDVENRTNYVCVSVCPSSSKSHIPPVNNHNFKKIPGKVACLIILIEDYQIEIAKLHPSFFRIELSLVLHIKYIKNLS